MIPAPSLPKEVRLEPGVNGLRRLVVHNGLATAHLYLQGATLTHFEPAGQRPVLFVSRQSVYEPGKPIRGGVPICWPWFGPHPTDASQPAHGYARTQEWSIVASEALATGETRVSLSLTTAIAELRYAVTVGSSLTYKLTTRNITAAPMTITEALHTYLAVGDVRQISVEGLGGAVGLDRLSGNRIPLGAEPIRITGEYDRTYVNTTAAATLIDPVFKRRIVVSKRGSQSTVVWNPWIEKSKTLHDLADDEYFGFVCIETANAADNAVTIGPGQTHEVEASVAVA